MRVQFRDRRASIVNGSQDLFCDQNKFNLMLQSLSLSLCGLGRTKFLSEVGSNLASRLNLFFDYLLRNEMAHQKSLLHQAVTGQWKCYQI